MYLNLRVFFFLGLRGQGLYLWGHNYLWNNATSTIFLEQILGNNLSTSTTTFCLLHKICSYRHLILHL